MVSGTGRPFHVISILLCLFSMPFSPVIRVFLAFCMGWLSAFPGSYVIRSQLWVTGISFLHWDRYTRIGYTSCSIRLFGQSTCLYLSLSLSLNSFVDFVDLVGLLLWKSSPLFVQC
jgi:hypothetical protein